MLDQDPDEPAEKDQPISGKSNKANSKRPQFGLKTSFIVVAIIGILFAYYANAKYQYDQETLLIAELESSLNRQFPDVGETRDPDEMMAVFTSIFRRQWTSVGEYIQIPCFKRVRNISLRLAECEDGIPDVVNKFSALELLIIRDSIIRDGKSKLPRALQDIKRLTKQEVEFWAEEFRKSHPGVEVLLMLPDK